MEIIDTHAHLVELTDIENVINRARNQGLKGIIAVSTKVGEFEKIISISAKYAGFIYAALGIHPTEFFDENLDDALETMRSRYGSYVAIGEIGLDFWHKLVRKNTAIKKRQIDFYEAQIKVAKELGLAASIHSRGAWSDCLDMAVKNELERGVFHWYSGPIEELKGVLDHGYYVSCTPAIEWSQELRAAMNTAPIERILVETDTPVWLKTLNRPSEPVDVYLTVKHLASLKGLQEEDVAKATIGNARELFKL